MGSHLTAMRRHLPYGITLLWIVQRPEVRVLWQLPDSIWSEVHSGQVLSTRPAFLAASSRHQGYILSSTDVQNWVQERWLRQASRHLVVSFTVWPASRCVCWFSMYCCWNARKLTFLLLLVSCFDLSDDVQHDTFQFFSRHTCIWDFVTSFHTPFSALMLLVGVGQEEHQLVLSPAAIIPINSVLGKPT